jgi:hypothetical protein
LELLYDCTSGFLIHISMRIKLDNTSGCQENYHHCSMISILIEALQTNFQISQELINDLNKTISEPTESTDLILYSLKQNKKSGETVPLNLPDLHPENGI